MIRVTGKEVLGATVTVVLALAGCGEAPPPASNPLPKIDVKQDIRAKTKAEPFTYQDFVVGSAKLEDLRQKFPDAKFEGADDGRGYCELSVFSSADMPLEIGGQPLRRVDFACWDGALFATTLWYDSNDFEAMEKVLQVRHGEGEGGVPGLDIRMWMNDGQTMTLSRRAGTVWMKDDRAYEVYKQARSEQPAP